MARKELGPHALEVSRAVARMIDGVPRAVVGCSGGPDSLALALGARWAARRTGTTLIAVVVDHQLQEGSAQVAAEAAETVTERGIEARVVTVDIPGGRDGQSFECGPEAAARTARRAALSQVAGADPVLLGHTLDDQAETVLLGLARGSGTASLAGIRPRAGRFWHPLLGVRRAATRAACREWGVTPWQDPQNADPAFLRSRVRRETMPMLERGLGPGIAEALARTASLLQGDEEILDAITGDWLESQGADTGHLPLQPLAAAPTGLSRRVVKAWLAGAGVDASFAHVEAVRGLCRSEGGRGVDLPGARVVRRGRQLVLVVAAPTR